jgi:acetyl-CoA C-acetyltransferase
MALDPRTPVVVGVGQVTTPADAGLAAADRPEPLELMTAALRAAAEDCDAAAPGAPARAGSALLRRADSLRVVAPLGWHAVNPALAVASSLGRGPGSGSEPGQLMVSAIGGNSPQALMHDACRAISRGDLDVVLVTGAEAMYARALARRDPAKPWLEWASQPPETPAPEVHGVDKAGASELEMNRGVILPVHAYPLFENALRAANGWTLEEHAARIGALWSQFSEVAAGNPDAWIRKARTPAQIMTPSPDNRMISFPYPKLCTANMQVDQGAGYIVCSVEAARAAGVPDERWVFPLSGADANDHWFISQRTELHRSPAIRLAGAAALALAGLGIDDIAAVDLYSCFPAAVQMAAAELGLGVDDPARPLTLTGGLTFGGGPGNNYTSHGIARAVGALRAATDSAALVTGLGWYATKHSIGVYASRPPEAGDGPFAWRDVQPEVDALPQCAVDETATGRVRVETYTVTFDRDGSPDRGIVACRTAADARAWTNITDADTLGALCVEEGIGRTGVLTADGVLDLDD